MKKFLTSILLSTLIAGLIPTSVLAQGDVNITLTPPTIDTMGGPGDEIIETVTFKNYSTGDYTLTPEILDFYYDNNGNEIFVTPDVESSEEYDAYKKYSLKNWITVPDELFIKADDKADVEIQIKVPEDAQPGGHYALLSYGVAPTNADGTTGVGIGANVGLLILINIPGEFKKPDRLQSGLVPGILDEQNGFDPNYIFWKGSYLKNGPVSFKIDYFNNNSTHFKPQGTITVKNIFGQVKGTTAIDSQRVFPGTSRPMFATLEKNLFFGPYFASLTIYDQASQAQKYSTIFVGLPIWILLTIILAILAWRFHLKWYKKRMLKELEKTKKEKEEE